MVKQDDVPRLLTKMETISSGDYELDSAALMLGASRLCGDPVVRLRVLEYVAARVRDEVALLPEVLPRKK